MSETTEKEKSLNTTLRIEQPEKVYPVMKALASMERLEILNLLGQRSMNIRELSEALRLPMSSTTMHVQQLEEAKLIKTVIRPGARGNIKLCSGCVRALSVMFTPQGDSFQAASQVARYNLPIGAYSEAIRLKPTCGLGSTTGLIDRYDIPASFYDPGRLNAQVIWFREGFLEYRFPLKPDRSVQWLELSFEGNPQTASYHAPWKSDISVYVNDRKLGTWESCAERSVRRGFLTPSWWNTVNTQYGELKIWRVNARGSYLDSQRISDTALKDLNLEGNEMISVRIGIESDAANIGGLVLFGEKFGDYEQGITLRIGYNDMDKTSENFKA